MNFGQAIEALKAGTLVQRKGWNGQGQYLELIQPPQSATPSDTRYEISDGDEYTPMPDIVLRPWIGIKTVDNQFMPWSPSQSDVLCEDWIQV